MGVVETRWLGGSFLMVYRNNAGRLVSVFISVCLETRWLGQKSGFYVPERPCNGKFPLGEPRDVVGEKNSKTSWRFDGYKGILAWPISYEIIFGWHHPCHIVNPEFEDSFHSKVLWRYEHQKVVYRNVGKNGITSPAKSSRKFGHASILLVKSHWTMNISASFSRSQSPLDDLKITFWGLH